MNLESGYCSTFHNLEIAEILKLNFWSGKHLVVKTGFTAATAITFGPSGNIPESFAMNSRSENHSYFPQLHLCRVFLGNRNHQQLGSNSIARRSTSQDLRSCGSNCLRSRTKDCLARVLSIVDTVALCLPLRDLNSSL